MRNDGKATVGVLADDLTSAADGAGPFVMRGRGAWVGRGRLPRQTSDVIAVDSGSRSAPEAEVAERVARLTAQLASRDILYKTVDSTLRGHVRSELDAAFRASGRKRLVFAPAFPAAGRTTVGGVQCVDGIPVSETAYGRDPVHPARHSVLADLVPPSIGNVVLLDATTQDELDAQVAALPEPEATLWVGSPGMAAALARRLAPAATEAPAAAVGCGPGNILIVIGSANPRSHRQADQIERASGVTLLRSPAKREDDPAPLLLRIARDAADRLHAGAFDALIATGGDTIAAILDLLDVQEFEILHELEPGFPLGRAWLDDGRPLLLAMKAGGFGGDDTLRRAVTRLRHGAPLSGRGIADPASLETAFADAGPLDSAQARSNRTKKVS
ncbi:four-carbon acid sugar kinase family protein [Bosea sp. 2KB_26]|uniref:four-carbon acid sugar kinase family protein n=1 Tax=Bosea sp. 2KB_26 TaxID=3237475 RepID=UPI003F904D1F